MQLALRAADSTAPSYRTKMMVAGIAAASASVIAINPVSPALPDLQEHAVELAAFTNPLVTLQQTFANTFNNLGALSTATAGATTTAATALSNPAVYQQIANFIAANATNPGPLLSQLANFNANYGALIGTQSALSQAALQTSLANLPATLQNSLNFLTSGQFVEAFSELNIYFLVQLIERPGNPLVPLFQIPGDIAATLPGGQVVANVLDALLTRGVFSGLTRALFVAPITATLQAAEIFDAIRAAAVVGDVETALSELINLPIKVANAFVNGYVPNFPTRSLFQGLLSPNGPLDYFLVDLPNAIFGALNASAAPPVVTAPVTTTTATLASVASTDLALGATTVALTEAAPAAKAEAVVGSEGTGTEPAIETETEPAADTTPVETPAVTPVSDETEADETATEVEAAPEKSTATSGSNKPVSSYGTDKTDTTKPDADTDADTSKSESKSESEASKPEASTGGAGAAPSASASSSSDSSSSGSSGSSGSDE